MQEIKWCKNLRFVYLLYNIYYIYYLLLYYLFIIQKIVDDLGENNFNGVRFSS